MYWKLKGLKNSEMDNFHNGVHVNIIDNVKYYSVITVYHQMLTSQVTQDLINNVWGVKELSPNVEVKNPSINRPLGLALWSKIKSNIGANAFVDFSSLLGLKNKNKSFEITENLGECKIKPIKQTNEISAITQCVQDFFFLLEFIQKSPHRESQL